MKALNRTLEAYAACDPALMAKMSEAAIFHAFVDMKKDIATLAAAASQSECGTGAMCCYRAAQADPAQAAPEIGEQDDMTPGEVLGSRLIDAWIAEHGRQIPWTKAVAITAITTKMTDDEKARFLSLDDHAPRAPQFLSASDMVALRRFDECCEDSDSGGYDVPKDVMRRLSEIGVVRSVGFSRYEMTAFGRHVIEAGALPLTTYEESCAIAARANQEKTA